jgi:hypothetical protein
MRVPYTGPCSYHTFCFSSISFSPLHYNIAIDMRCSVHAFGSPSGRGLFALLHVCSPSRLGPIIFLLSVSICVVMIMVYPVMPANALGCLPLQHMCPSCNLLTVGMSGTSFSHVQHNTTSAFNPSGFHFCTDTMVQCLWKDQVVSVAHSIPGCVHLFSDMFRCSEA